MPYIGNTTADFSIDTGNITNRAVTATKLSPSSVGSNGQVLSVDGSGNLQWGNDANAPEGTAVLSTGESGTTKYLRVDGDGTCSWQLAVDATKMPLAGGTFTGDVTFTGDSSNGLWDKSANAFVANLTGTASGNAVLTGSTNNQLVTVTGANAITGEANLTFDGNQLFVTTGISSDALIVNSTYANRKLIVRETGDGNSNTGIQLQKKHSTLHPANHWYGDIAFMGWDGSGYHRGGLIECVAEGTPANDNMPGNLRFSTNPGQVSQVERMRIHADGQITMGNDASGAGGWDGNLVVATTTGGIITVGDTGSGEKLHLEGGAGAPRIGTTSNHSLNFFTNGTTNVAMTITTAQKILINNSVSNTMWGYGQGNLQLTGDYQEASASFINDEDNANSHAITLAKIRGSNAVQDEDCCGSLAWNGYDGSQYRPVARIMANVDIAPSSDMPGRLVFETTGDGALTPTTRMLIDSSGKIGINEDDLKSRLHIYEIANGVKQSVLRLDAHTDTTGDGAFIDFGSRWGGAYPDWVSARIGGIYYTGAGSSGGNRGAIEFMTANDSAGANGGVGGCTTRMVLRPDGDLSLNTGNLVVSNGKGIDFSAMSDTEGGAGSATSEILDDYEFGTWTPAYLSTGGTYGYSTQSGWYCKVGKFVTVRAQISTNSVSATSHNLVKVTGLPFQVAYRTPGSIRCNGFQSSGTLEGFPSAFSFEHNQTHGELQRFDGNGNTDFTTSTMNNTTNVYIAGTYKID